MKLQNFIRNSQAGQAIVLIVFMIIALVAAVGIAVDAGVGYYYNTSAERAAAAAALSGVIFMPYQFAPASSVPAGAGNDATDRAINEARRNGFDVNDAVHGVQVIPAAVPGYTNKLQVTVQRTVPTFFMGMFGVNSYIVKRVAIATYLPPISLGQPGNQTGSTSSQLGTGNNYFFMREEGWSTPRSQGDAFTPDPASGPSTDVHQISQQTGSDLADPSLPGRGGYNYNIYLPAGGYIQVYNAAFAPDGNGGKPHNNCENSKVGAAIGPCSSGGSYYLHEEDSTDFTNVGTFNTMEYTLFRQNSIFIRSSDTKLAQVKVFPIDASNWNAANNQYLNVNTNQVITQTYAGSAPSNMLIYHAWMDVPSYAGAGDNGLVQRTMAPIGSLLGPGTYRLRVDTLDRTGTSGTAGGLAHKGYAVRALDPSLSGCAGCTVGAMNDLCFYTPIQTVGGQFTMPIFQLPPDYAGQTITLDVFDPGDISGGGNVDLYILDPSGGVLTEPAGTQVTMYDLGTSRNNASPPVINTGNPQQAYVRATTAGSTLYNGHWIRFQMPIPNTYAPGANPNNWWWSMQYRVSTNVTATDTITVAVGLRGNPAHLLIS